MAVVTETGPKYTGDLADRLAQADYRYAGGRLTVSYEELTIAVGDEATSTYHVARVPARGVLMPGGELYTTAAVTGTVDLGAGVDMDALLAGVAGAATTSYPFLKAVVGKPFWEVFGYADAEAAPAWIDVYVTLVGLTQATAPGTGYVYIPYTYT